MSITRLVASYRLTTPMFCSGADQQSAELRPASLKGALRFWYRALALAQYKTFEEVRNAEDVLFGSTRTGQANVLLSLRETNTGKPLKAKTILNSGRAYLAGLGLTEQIGGKTQTKRDAIAPGSQFAIHLLLKDDSNKIESDLLKDALICLGLLGGLGSRSRRGFGSLTLETLVQDNNEIWCAPNSLDALKDVIESLISPRTSKLTTPPYSAFSPETRILLLPENSQTATADILHEKLGLAFLHFRSYGQDVNGKRVVAGHDSLKIFKNDHHNMSDVAHGDVEDWVTAPQRAAFGLPHNYYFKSDGLSVKVNPATVKRRASPLFFHIHQCAGALPVAVACFLPAKFLPEPRLKIWSKKSGNVKANLPKPAQFWEPIHRFLDALQQRNDDKLCVAFPGTVEVKP